MGIDIYAKWNDQTLEEKNEQVTGFSTAHGHVGYLREAYHGEPYATQFLVREAFQSEDGTAYIPASILRERLPETLVIAEERERTVYGTSEKSDIDPVLQSFRDFDRDSEEAFATLVTRGRFQLMLLKQGTWCQRSVKVYHLGSK